MNLFKLKIANLRKFLINKSKFNVPLKLLLTFTFLIYIPIFFIYFKETVSLHFIDEYNNLIAGYFLTKGKVLYSEIFFQHQPLMAYLSFILQEILNPETLYKFIHYHRLFVILFAFLFNILIVARFRLVGFFFVLLFELTKYYFFANTFLAESLIVYPIVYLFGLVWEKYNGKLINNLDIWLGFIFTIFVLLAREPYIPLVILLYFLIFIGVKNKIKVFVSILFLLFVLFFVFMFPLNEYLFQVIKVNSVAVISGEVAKNNLIGSGLINIFIYPILTLISGELNFLRGVLIMLSLIFLTGIIYNLSILRKIKNFLIIFLFLGISNIRMESPGASFYSAYHMVVWYGLYVFITAKLIKDIFENKSHYFYKKLVFVLIFILSLYIISPLNNFIWTKTNRVQIFNDNYAQYYVNGEVIKLLSNSSTTFFIDGWESLTYWQADQKVNYPYLFYYPPMVHFKLYTDAKLKMFNENPPDFVYSECILKNNKLIASNLLIEKEYEVFFSGTNPTCLFINKKSIKMISDEKWEQIEKFDYRLESRETK